jgi:hypothetical protein
MQRLLRTSVVAACLCTAALADYNVQWARFRRAQDRLDPRPTAVSNQNTEVEFAWGDLNKDGWIDLVVVRKEPVTTAGKRTGILLMNENGTLYNRTAEYASQSDVPGDMGLLTPTNTRDVVITDVNGDGWDDFVTATTLSIGDPKHIGHPRVYMNLGLDGNGDWLGFRFEDARMPQLRTIPGNQAHNPRFCSVAAGDVTGDDRPDLYFGDYDSSGAGGGGENPNEDLNDRLLVNDGNGFFTDSGHTRMTAAMLESAFSMAVVIEDMNLDGVLDVVKDSALNTPQRVSVAYNNPGNEGQFGVFDPFHSGFAPYHTNVGDMNNDGRPDVVITDDGDDRYRYNLSTDAFGRVVWGPAKLFQFQVGAATDDGFGGDNLVVDLDNDGWNDVIITDVDIDIAGCNRRTHIYHNPGGPVGSQIDLIEERQQPAGGWVGVVGIGTGDLTGTHDVAVFDINNDGWPDMVLGRCTGTFVWLNDTHRLEPDFGGILRIR